jgi:sarcosine oxidase subunit beta
MSQPDVVVIGAGVIGAAVAWRLSRRGYAVHVIEKHGVASGASGAAEGLVGSVAKRPSGPVTDLVVESFAMFPGLGEELESDIEFTRKPGLMAVMDETHLAILERFVARKRAAGLSIELLDRKAAREAEPLLSDAVVAAIYTPDQGMVNPLRLTRAYLAVAKRHGATVATGTAVRALERRGDRIVGIDDEAGRLSAGLVVNAAGCGTTRVAETAGTRAKILPKRAQMLVSERLPPGLLRNTIYCAQNVTAGLNPQTLEFEDTPSADGGREAELQAPWQLSSFTQTSSGTILFCGGFGFAGDTIAVDLSVLTSIAGNIATVVPSFRSLRIVRAWAGLEPCTVDNLPIVGQAPGVKNLFHATGHGNAGVMMSPVTGSLVADLIADGVEAPILKALDPGRFDAAAGALTS